MGQDSSGKTTPLSCSSVSWSFNRCSSSVSWWLHMSASVLHPESAVRAEYTCMHQHTDSSHTLPFTDPSAPAAHLCPGDSTCLPALNTLRALNAQSTPARINALTVHKHLPFGLYRSFSRCSSFASSGSTCLPASCILTALCAHSTPACINIPKVHRHLPFGVHKSSAAAAHLCPDRSYVSARVLHPESAARAE